MWLVAPGQWGCTAWPLVATIALEEGLAGFQVVCVHQERMPWGPGKAIVRRRLAAVHRGLLPGLAGGRGPDCRSAVMCGGQGPVRLVMCPHGKGLNREPHHEGAEGL